MGINVLNNTSSQEVILTAGSAIASGDLIVNAESGSAQVASSVLSIAQNNNATSGPSVLSALTAPRGYGAYSSPNSLWNQNICQLSTGNLVMVSSGDGSASQVTPITIIFKNIVGGAPYGVISISETIGTASALRVYSLGSNGFVVLWTNSSAALRYAVYSNTGTVISAPATIATLNSASSTAQYNVGVLTNYDFVVCYRKATSNDFAFSRFNYSGTLQGAETTVEAASSPTAMMVLPQSNGGFYTYHFRSSATASFKFARYNSSGTLQGSLTSLGTSTGLTTGNQNNLAIELSNGNVVFQHYGSASTVAYSVYSSTGSAVISDQSVDTTTQLTNQIQPMVAKATGGFSILGFTTNAPSNHYLYTYDNNGANLTFRVSVAYSSTTYNTTSNYGNILFDLGNLGYAIFTQVAYSSCGTFYGGYLWVFDATGATIGTPLIWYSPASTAINNFWAILTSDGSLAFKFTINTTTNSYDQWAVYALQKKSIIGVAQSSVSANASVRVATIGSYTLNANYAVGASFDKRSSTPPGTRGTVAGTSAVLFGMQS